MIVDMDHHPWSVTFKRCLCFVSSACKCSWYGRVGPVVSATGFEIQLYIVSLGDFQDTDAPPELLTSLSAIQSGH